MFVGVVGDHPFVVGIHMAGDAACVHDSDFSSEIALRHTRIQFVGLIVI